jgi:DNA-binding NarL/FixJ family response regulator
MPLSDSSSRISKPPHVANLHHFAILVTCLDSIPDQLGRLFDQLADALLHTRPDCRVLLVSGYNEEMLADRAADSTGDGVIQKPIAPAVLATEVREILDRPNGQSAQAGSTDAWF